MKSLTLCAMIFCHVLADYNLQGWLANAKQARWWEQNHPSSIYRNDYKIALFMHSFAWSFMVMLPILLIEGNWYPFIFSINTLLHYLIDNEKANKLSINLIEDQNLHLLQIIFAWICCCVF